MVLPNSDPCPGCSPIRGGRSPGCGNADRLYRTLQSPGVNSGWPIRTAARPDQSSFPISVNVMECGCAELFFGDFVWRRHEVRRAYPSRTSSGDGFTLAAPRGCDVSFNCKRMAIPQVCAPSRGAPVNPGHIDGSSRSAAPRCCSS